MWPHSTKPILFSPERVKSDCIKCGNQHSRAAVARFSRTTPGSPRAAHSAIQSSPRREIPQACSHFLMLTRPRSLCWSECFSIWRVLHFLTKKSNWGFTYLCYFKCTRASSSAVFTMLIARTRAHVTYVCQGGVLMNM